MTVLDLDPLRRVLGDCERTLNKAWQQWADQDSKGRKYAGGLSTLEHIALALGRVEAKIARLEHDLKATAYERDIAEDDAGVTGLDADLATLGALQTAVEYLVAGGAGRRDEIARLLDDAPGARKRVEAEIARLRETQGSATRIRELLAINAQMTRHRDEQAQRAEAAESELATATTTMELAIRQLEAAERGRDDAIEAALLNVAQEMFPDFDFSGCYDADDLRNHMKGQATQLREDAVAAERERDEALKAVETWAEAAKERHSEREAAERERADQLRITENVYGLLVDAKRERNVAEREVARLREGLREIADDDKPRTGNDDWILVGWRHVKKARALLAEDGAAKGCEYHRPLKVNGCRACEALDEDGAARQVKADPAVFGESNRLLGAEDGAADA